jgi:hypothetical protein
VIEERATLLCFTLVVQPDMYMAMEVGSMRSSLGVSYSKGSILYASHIIENNVSGSNV